MEDHITDYCFLEDQDIGFDPKNNIFLDVEILSLGSPAQSTSAYIYKFLDEFPTMMLQLNYGIEEPFYHLPMFQTQEIYKLR